MVKKIVDLHIHSKYSRACSKDLDLSKIAVACEEKGIDIVTTGDFTHPLWFKSMNEELTETGKSGIYKLKNNGSKTRFIIGTEISCVYKHRGKTRRLHLLVFAPDFDSAARFIIELEGRGVNLRSDGRPIMGLSGKEILKICLAINKRMVVVPAHAWTPWYSVFGSKSGYDSLEECFEELTPEIFAIETGLSSDPPMNRRLSRLDQIALISNSDAHSLQNLGREANVLSFRDESSVSYDALWEAVRSGDKKKFLYTIEFYPEEGMYHFDGHRDCRVSMAPGQTKKEKELCPKCKKKMTVGVLNRVEKLADRKENPVTGSFVPHRYIVPLREVIAGAFKVGKQSKKVETEYRNLLKKLGNEFYILLQAGLDEIGAAASRENIAIGIGNMREGRVRAVAGYDGVYGTIDVFSGKKIEYLKQKK